MTCEVAVMNKRGVALAADSAVSLGAGDKVYYTAEKLFQISTAPIGIMSYGSADMMGVPWETIIKIYSNELGGRRFDHVEQYAEDFLRFIETSESLFSGADQNKWFCSLVGGWWKEGFLEPLQKQLKEKRVHSSRQANAILNELIAEDEACWKTYPPLAEGSMERAEHILKTYGSSIEELEKELFKGFELSSENRDKLRHIVKSMYALKWIHPADRSGIVVAGFGESEAFPVVSEYEIGTIAAGKLRYIKLRGVVIDHSTTAAVASFAKEDMVDMFYDGICPDLKKKLIKVFSKFVSDVVAKTNHKLGKKASEENEKEIRVLLQREITDKYKEPLMTAIDALPRYDLAKMAEALVSLTAMQARMSAVQKETVGGPIDVVLISKGDGFTWIKRKDAFGNEAALNAFCAASSFVSPDTRSAKRQRLKEIEADTIYECAVKVVINKRKASPGFVQRELNIDFKDAVEIVERMEREGIISPAAPDGTREIYGRYKGEK